MSTFLVVVSILAAVIGLFMLSSATWGVGVICLGCFLAVLARLAQAKAYRDEDEAKAAKHVDPWGPKHPN